jgi:WD40 repeat protein
MTVHTLAGHSHFVLSVAYSPDGEYLASCSKDSTVKEWEAKSGKLLHTVKHPGEMSSLSYFPDGKYLAACSYDGSVIIIETSTFKDIYQLTAHAEWVISVVCSPDGKYLASGSGDKTIKVWKIEQANISNHKK